MANGEVQIYDNQGNFIVSAFAVLLKGFLFYFCLKIISHI